MAGVGVMAGVEAMARVTCSFVWRIIHWLKTQSRMEAGGRAHVVPEYAGFTYMEKKFLLVKGCSCRKLNWPLRSAMSLPTGVPVTHHLFHTQGMFPCGSM